jgi:hypothetical protein
MFNVVMFDYCRDSNIKHFSDVVNNLKETSVGSGLAG